MTPDVPAVLNGVVRSLMVDVAPEVKSEYGTLNLQLMCALLMMIAQEFDRAAERLLVENEALAQLFHEACALVTDAALSADIESAASRRSAGLTVSALRETNRRRRDLLVRLHGHVETLDDPAAAALDGRIWAELVESTRRRQLDLAVA